MPADIENLDITSFINEIKGLFDKPQAKSQENIAGSFQVPIKSSYHNSGGFDPTGHGSVGRIHQGIDLRAPGGTAIYPIAPGTVSAVQPDPKGGNTVNVQHANGITSYYAHMGTISAHKGDKVNLDTVLGTVGASGNAKGFPHLHLQVWSNGKLIDPASVISVPSYTAFNPKAEKLWLEGAKATADNWNLREHINSRNSFQSARAEKLVELADRFYKISVAW